MKLVKTLGELKKSNYQPKSVKQEMRDNLVYALQHKLNLFEEIKGYEHSVIPQLETAILSKHNIIFLGLRGQAKTRMARLMVKLLDEYIPVVEGSEINDDPFAPISVHALSLIQEYGDDTPISWIHRDERYTEKLATPDVSVSDLIGDIDPIKAANLKLSYADERVIHYGLIPRSHRGIFVINELPDLQARIQVSLFNILQEGDLQIRGFKLRLPLDIQFVFTANPEDYTNRGSIVTPLKDRIDSQILTHYPKSIEVSKQITEQEIRPDINQQSLVFIPDLIKELIEEVAMQARKSELVDQKSGVSARLTISALENVYSAAERRCLTQQENTTAARIIDVYAAVAAITGKVELVYEGELEGAQQVAYTLIGKAIRALFEKYFPNPDKQKKSKQPGAYTEIIKWFNDGNIIELSGNTNEKEYQSLLTNIPGAAGLVKHYIGKLSGKEEYIWMEFLLNGLAECSQISKTGLPNGQVFKDLMSGMLGGERAEDDGDFGGYYEA